MSRETDMSLQKRVHAIYHQENMSVKCISPHTRLLYSKTGVYRSITYFLISDPKHRLWVLVRTASARRQNYQKYQILIMEIFKLYNLICIKKFSRIFSLSLLCSKHRLWAHIRSHEYSQSMVWSKRKKENRYNPANPVFYIKNGFKEEYFSLTCFTDVLKVSDLI